MDHRNRPRGIGLSRIPGTQSRTPRAPLPLLVEQEAREGEELEQREVPRQRTPVYVTPIYAPPETEEVTDNVMGKEGQALPSLGERGMASYFSFCGHRKRVKKPKAKYVMGRTGVRDEFGMGRFLSDSKGCHKEQPKCLFALACWRINVRPFFSKFPRT